MSTEPQQKKIVKKISETGETIETEESQRVESVTPEHVQHSPLRREGAAHNLHEAESKYASPNPRTSGQTTSTVGSTLSASPYPYDES